MIKTAGQIKNTIYTKCEDDHKCARQNWSAAASQNAFKLLFCKNSLGGYMHSQDSKAPSCFNSKACVA